ncbi:hypothetical protein B566_EDAN010768 [Ephemera danica]|nr:hypothetical protein B566_EDAN010768 [Ephemera danica]
MKYYAIALLFLVLAFYVVREEETIPIEMEVKNIATNLIKCVSTGETVTMESLWKNETCVIIFFRRWGCLFCRLWAHDLKEISPILKQNNIRLIGVGPEEIGIQDFTEGKYFDGELYIDTEKKTYNGLGFKRFSYLSILWALLTKTSRDAISRGKAANLGGDFKGDGLQNGGALIVGAGGKMLFSYRQEEPAEHVTNSKILEVLGLAEKGTDGADVKTEKLGEKCTDSCSIPGA